MCQSFWSDPGSKMEKGPWKLLQKSFCPTHFTAALATLVKVWADESHTWLCSTEALFTWVCMVQALAQIPLQGGCALPVGVRVNPRQCSQASQEDAECRWMHVEEPRGRCEAALTGAAVSWVSLGSDMVERTRVMPCVPAYGVERTGRRRRGCRPFRNLPPSVNLPGL